MSKLYEYIRHLSIDVAFASVSMSLFLSQTFNAELNLFLLALLFSSTFLIYNSDHLYDSFKIKDNPSLGTRHYFIRKHRKLVFLLSGFFLLASLILVFLLPIDVLYFGFVAAFITSLYFLITKVLKIRSGFIKVLFVAMGFTVGISVPFVAGLETVSYSMPLVLIKIFFIAQYNTILFNFYEMGYDQKVGLKESRSDYFENKGLRKLPIFFYVLVSVFHYITFSVYEVKVYWLAEIILIIMMTVLFSIDLFQNYFSKEERYRKIGDGIFYIPIIFFPFL